jgi:hypothetical protein
MALTMRPTLGCHNRISRSAVAISNRGASHQGGDGSQTVAAQLQQIYDANKNSQDREVVAASTVLSTLIAALLDQRALELSDYVRPFSQMELDRLQEVAQTSARPRVLAI